MDHLWITVIALPSCIRRRGSEWGSYAYHLSNLNSLVVRILDLGPLNLRTETQTETETGNQQKQTQTQELQTIIQEKKCTDMQWCEYYIAVCDHVTVIGMWPLSILEFMVTICGAPFWNGCGKNDCFCFGRWMRELSDAPLFFSGSFVCRGSRSAPSQLFAWWWFSGATCQIHTSSRRSKKTRLGFQRY